MVIKVLKETKRKLLIENLCKYEWYFGVKNLSNYNDYFKWK